MVESKPSSLPTSSQTSSIPHTTPNHLLQVKRHSDYAKVPTRGSLHAAGYDLYSAETKIIPAQGRALIDTQISIVVPEGTYGRIAPRSGLASKFGIATGAGVIDADYRGIIYILLFNLGERDFEISVGDRVAQLILERVATPNIAEVQAFDDNLPTSSASTGF